MNGYWKRLSALVLMLLMLTVLLSGCWDNHEIEEQYVLTAIALDAADTPDKISITVQVPNLQEQGSAQAQEPVIILHNVNNSLLSGIQEMNRNSNHDLLFHHNQIRLFGTELAARGIRTYLDLSMRDPKSRLEVPLAVVDGIAQNALTVKLAQAPVTGIFMGGMFEDLAKISDQYKVRLLDFMNKLLDGTVAPVLPIIQVVEGDEVDYQKIKLAGMAVFDESSRMIGRLSNEETLGYIWSQGKVGGGVMSVFDGTNRAILSISNLDCKRKVELRLDGGVRVSLKITANVNVAEISGFEQLNPEELIDYVQAMAQEEIKTRISDTLSVAQTLNADIFGFCTMVYKKYPKQWKEMEGRWNELFADIQLDVQPKVKILATGQMVQSLGMEEKIHENR